MNRANIEIRDVKALRLDVAGRVGRLRVIGVADQPDQRIAVGVCIAQHEGAPPSWCDQTEDAIARTVDPARTFVHGIKPEFKPQWEDPYPVEPRRGYLWMAEIDLLASPAVPPIVVGPQPVPISVHARYVFRDKEEAFEDVYEIRPTEEFDVGVLFVHGIGKQRRAETLAQWSAPLLQWINAWLSGATDEIASKIRRTLSNGRDEIATKDLQESLEGWFNNFAVREDPTKLEPDYDQRASYARRLLRKALAPTYKNTEHELTAMHRQAGALKDGRRPTSDEKSAAAKVICALEDIKASAVGGSAALREAYTLDVGTYSINPSSVEMHVEAMAPDGYLLRSRWLLAESHWAETFWAPSFFAFGRWCLLTAPLVLVHYVAMARLRQPMWRWIPGLFGFAVAVTLAQLGVVLLSVFWLVPWQGLRASVLRVQMGLAGVVGDSYVLLADPVQRRAIVDRVDRNLEWLVPRCRHVVVIAHSQGAAVAEQVLSLRQADGTGRIQSFLTLGAGVRTLSAIETLAATPGAQTAGWAAIGCVLLLGGAAALAMMRNGPSALLLAVAAVAGLIAAAHQACRVHRGWPSGLPRPAWLTEWFDFFARRDLVPYGPIVDPQNKGPENREAPYRPKEVRNRDSFAADHVTYWQNAEQVVGLLAREIGRAAGFKPLAELLPNDGRTLAWLERSRLSRLRFLRGARYAMVLAAAILLYTNGDAWREVGAWAIIWAQAKFGLAIDARAPAPVVWLQALVVFVPLVVQKSLVNAIFDGWTTVEVEQLLRRSAGKLATHWAATFTMVPVIVLAATIGYVWPMYWRVVAPATAVSAIVMGWIARRLHVKWAEGFEAGEAGTASPDVPFNAVTPTPQEEANEP